MKLFRPFLVLFSVPFLLFAACHSHSAPKGGAVHVADSVTVDSDALVLSLTPTVDCLPFYYAQKSGIYKTLGLKVSLKTYKSQFDCDTAMLGTTAIGGITDLVRLHYYANKGQLLSAVMSVGNQWHLIVSGGLRIKKTDLLEKRMVSVARFSVSDYYCEQAIREGGLDYTDVFRPQINDYYLRTTMLNNNQIDAAMLPEPYVTLARMAGHRDLCVVPKDSSQLGCLVFKPSLLSVADSSVMLKSIVEGYNMAVEALNSKGKSACQEILLNEYKLPKSVVDSLVLPQYGKARFPNKKEMDESLNFIKNHGTWKLNEVPSVLYNRDLLKK